MKLLVLLAAISAPFVLTSTVHEASSQVVVPMAFSVGTTPSPNGLFSAVINESGAQFPGGYSFPLPITAGSLRYMLITDIVGTFDFGGSGATTTWWIRDPNTDRVIYSGILEYDAGAPPTSNRVIDTHLESPLWIQGPAAPVIEFNTGIPSQGTQNPWAVSTGPARFRITVVGRKVYSN